MTTLADDAANRSSDGHDQDAERATGSSAGASGSPTLAASPKSAGGRSPSSPQYSCVSGSNKGEPRQRTDAKGNAISKTDKKHKVYFLDDAKPGSSIEEVKEVRSFKNQGSGCGCSVM